MTHGHRNDDPCPERSTPAESEEPSVSPTHAGIRKTVEAYLGRYPDERDALSGLLSVLDGPRDLSSRTTMPGHVTCSAVVIDREGRALHVHQKATGRLLAPGG